MKGTILCCVASGIGYIVINTTENVKDFQQFITIQNLLQALYVLSGPTGNTSQANFRPAYRMGWLWEMSQPRQSIVITTVNVLGVDKIRRYSQPLIHAPQTQ